MRPVSLVFATAVIALAGCAAEPPASPAEHGRVVYLAQCTACHAADPAQPGPLGPPLRGSSAELLEAKLLRGGYPAGYTPKRPTRLMPPQPQVARDVAALAAFLK